MKALRLFRFRGNFCARAILGISAAIFSSTASAASNWQVHAESTNAAVSYAAAELTHVLEKAGILGAEESNDASFLLRVDPKLPAETISVFAKNKTCVVISGPTPRDVLHATYAFAQKELGARWLWPGKEGEFIPARKDYSPAKNFALKYKPTFKYRGFHLCGDWYRCDEFRTWMARNFINIHRHATSFRPGADNERFFKLWSTHSATISRKYFDEHPEYFTERGGKRYPAMICFSNPEVEELVYENLAEVARKNPSLEILSFFPGDNQEYCQCSLCAPKGVSTAWFDLYNKLSDRFRAEFPHIKLATIAYQGYSEVPANLPRNAEFIEYASYPRCNIHTFSAEGCTRNEAALKRMEEWRATGIPMGNYAYEFDIFSGPSVTFAPFYIALRDGIRKSAELGHISVITEVSLSPRSGAEEEITSCKNRLGIWLYAQLLWNPKLTLDELLSDWCKTAYPSGGAADFMKEYFDFIAKRWDAIPNHFGILGNPVGIAEAFLDPAARKKCEELLAKAAPSSPNVAFEQRIFAQWTRYLGGNGDRRLDVPKTSEPSALSPYSWTNNVFFAKIDAPFSLALSAGLGTGSAIFRADKNGKLTSSRISSVGVEETFDPPTWRYSGGIAEIDLTTVAQTTPRTGDLWQLSVNDETPQSLFFVGSSFTHTPLIYFSGSMNREHHGLAALRRDYATCGFNLFVAKDATEVADGSAALYRPGEMVWHFRNPRFGDKPLPVETMQLARESIELGSVAIFSGYSSSPLEKIFDDPTFEVKVRGIKGLELSQRYGAKSAAPGAWQTSPFNLSRGLSRGITPAYLLHPAHPEKWRVLATALNSSSSDETYPFILTRPYGKGLVVLISAEIPFSTPQLIANIIENIDSLK